MKKLTTSLLLLTAFTMMQAQTTINRDPQIAKMVSEVSKDSL